MSHPVLPDYGKVPDINRDVDQAKKLLAEAGYPNGLQTELAVPSDMGWIVAQCQAAVEQWKDIGVQVKLNVMPGAEYWNVWTKVPFGCTIWYHRPLGVMLLNLAYRTGVPGMRPATPTRNSTLCSTKPAAFWNPRNAPR